MVDVVVAENVHHLPGGCLRLGEIDPSDFLRPCSVRPFGNPARAHQCAMAPNRIYVQSGIYDTFAEKFSRRVSRLRVGNGFAEGSELGPLIDANAVKKVNAHLENALSLGARVTVGGEPNRASDQFFLPTVLVNVTSEMTIAREETFGPLAPLFSFDTEEQVIAMANDTEFGLAGYFYSRDLGRIFRVAEELETGMVGILSNIQGH